MVQPVDLSRRNLLRGKSVSAPQPIRPPGAGAEPEFIQRCTGCGDCVAACPEHIIIAGSGNYPEVDFRRGECTFCLQCIASCREQALLQPFESRWRIRLVVSDACLAKRQIVCQSCGDACAADAVRFQPRLGSVATPDISEDLCTGCGACVAACPEQAIEATAYG